VTDAHTTNVAIALSGGRLVDCPAELTTCTDNLARCTANALCEGALSVCEDNLSMCQAIPKGQRLQTGVVRCFDSSGQQIDCTGTKQDGELQKGLARSYTDNGDGTITDNGTGLVWEKLSDDSSIHDKDNKFTWDAAFATKVASFNLAAFAGHTDWRLPNVNELHSLVHYDSFPAISTAFAFPPFCRPGCTIFTCSCPGGGGLNDRAYYWTSSTSSGSQSHTAWVVDFDFGEVSVLSHSKTNSYRVRLVRGG
jgi:Protein of unknown function (DUF1566)